LNLVTYSSPGIRLVIPSHRGCGFIKHLFLSRIRLVIHSHRGTGAQLHSHRGIGFLNPFPTSIVSDLEYFLDIILGSLITLDSHRHSLIVDSPIHITVVDDPGFGSLTQSHLGIGSHDSFPNPQVL
jgi:hypothetical protein